MYANNRLQAAGGVDLDPPPSQMVWGGGRPRNFHILGPDPSPPPPEKSGKIAKNRENWVNSLEFLKIWEIQAQAPPRPQNFLN